MNYNISSKAFMIKNSYSQRERIRMFKSLPSNEKGEVLLSLPKGIKKNIINHLKPKEIISFIDYLDPDEITDLLQLLSQKKANKIAKLLDKNLKEKVDFLLRFNPKTAAGMMSLDYVEVEKEITFKELCDIIKKHEKKTGKTPTILVVENGFLIGELPAHILPIARKNEKITKYIKKIPHIRFDADEESVISKFKSNPHNKVVVLDNDNSIIGIIFSDDVLRVVESKSSKDLRIFAGVREEEDVNDPVIIKVKNRYKWLIINLFTAFLAASVVSLFQKTIQSYVYLAAYMPIVAGMGGNAATQVLAVMVRGIALKEIELKNSAKVIIKECVAGMINGVINGILVAIVAWLFNKNPLLGLITAMAMIINLLIAGFFGALIPLIMKSLGKDPATSATIFITTATDVFGFLAFLGLASIIL